MDVVRFSDKRCDIKEMYRGGGGFDPPLHQPVDPPVDLIMEKSGRSLRL